MAAPTLNITFTDGTTKTVKLNIQDTLQWENTARARHWAVDANVKSSIFMAWNALRRNGKYDGSWDEFQQVIEWVDEHDTAADSQEDITDESFPTKKAK